MWRKKKSNLPFAHFGLQYRFERFLAIGRLWLHTSATNACTHCTAPASAATALSAYSSYCCSTQNDSSYSICITQGELLQQQHTSTTHATQQHSSSTIICSNSICSNIPRSNGITALSGATSTTHISNICNSCLHSTSTCNNSIWSEIHGKNYQPRQLP